MLLNWDKFKLLYHTVPNFQNFKFFAIIQLLTHFRWTWVGIITSNQNINQQASLELKKEMEKHGICVDFITYLLLDPQSFKENASKVQKILASSSVKVNISYCSRILLLGFLETCSSNITEKVWISAEGMDGLPDYFYPKFLDKYNGSLEVTVHSKELPGFKNFLYRASWINMPDNIFL